jgi:hypothetical protein
LGLHRCSLQFERYPIRSNGAAYRTSRC